MFMRMKTFHYVGAAVRPSEECLWGVCLRMTSKQRNRGVSCVCAAQYGQRTSIHG